MKSQRCVRAEAGLAAKQEGRRWKARRVRLQRRPEDESEQIMQDVLENTEKQGELQSTTIPRLH